VVGKSVLANQKDPVFGGVRGMVIELSKRDEPVEELLYCGDISPLLWGPRVVSLENGIYVGIHISHSHVTTGL
jgi:hypothetical protein